MARWFVDVCPSLLLEPPSLVATRKARQLAKLHGGDIEAHSDGPGKGSEFTITLPTLAVAPPADDTTPPKPAARLRSRRILVVDDLRESAEMLAKLLRSMDQDATALYDGKAALSWILAERPQIVFLDIAMPGLDGYEVARRVRERRELDATTLVALTGLGQCEDRRRACGVGFDFHLTKPADIGQIEALLRTLRESRDPVTELAVSCATEDILFTDEVTAT